MQIQAGMLIQPLEGPLGARVSCHNLAKIGDDGRRILRQAFLDHLILIFSGLQLSDDDQLAVTGVFGPVGDAIHGPHIERHKVVTITNLGPTPLLGAGDLRWHTDHSFEERPLSASLLHAIEVPAEGGDTYWNNMYLAYERLPHGLRERVRGLTIKNDISTNSAGQRVERIPEVTDVRTSPGPSHPIIRTHPETGLNVLYLGRRPFAYVNGLSVEESEDLLDELWDHATQAEFAYRHHWQVGDMVVWDNRAVMHRRDAFDESLRRIMHRTQCAGDVPTYDASADVRGVHKRAHSATT